MAHLHNTPRFFIVLVLFLRFAVVAVFSSISVCIAIPLYTQQTLVLVWLAAAGSQFTWAPEPRRYPHKPRFFELKRRAVPAPHDSGPRRIQCKSGRDFSSSSRKARQSCFPASQCIELHQPEGSRGLPRRPFTEYPDWFGFPNRAWQSPCYLFTWRDNSHRS